MTVREGPELTHHSPARHPFARLAAHWRQDVLASIVVFLVALPLCMGIALACGAPASAGIVTGIVGGIVVGWFAGSPLQVSGPAAGLIVIVADVIREHGMAGLGVMVALAGVIQLAAGLLKLGQVFRAVAPAVIHGMLAGIGVLIFASQFHMMVDDVPKSGGLANVITIPLAVWKGIIPTDDKAHHWAAIVGLITIGVIVAWQLIPRRLRILPAPLIAVVAASLVATTMQLPIRYIDLPAQFSDAFTFPTLEAWSNLLSTPVIVGALTIALVASAETLLCAKAVDQMQSEVRTNYDKELAAQGTGNLLCGLFGALPMTGVIVRSSANVQSGARTRLSAMIHGAWLLLFVVAVPQVLALVPTASLAAVLVYTGYRLVNLRAIKELWGYGRSEVAIYAVTLASIVVFDLLTGIVAGIILSVAKLVYTFSHLRIHLEIDPQTNRTVLSLDGAATFIRLPSLASTLEQVPASAELHVDMHDLSYIDHACLDLLMNWEKQHERTGGRLAMDWESLTAKFHETGRNGSRVNVQHVGAVTDDDADPAALI